MAWSWLVCPVFMLTFAILIVLEGKASKRWLVLKGISIYIAAISLFWHAWIVKKWVGPYVLSLPSVLLTAINWSSKWSSPGSPGLPGVPSLQNCAPKHSSTLHKLSTFRLSVIATDDKVRHLHSSKENVTFSFHCKCSWWHFLDEH